MWPCVHVAAVAWAQMLCTAVQVGWEGPSECTFCPTLGVLRLHGLSAHLRPSVPHVRSKHLAA